MSEIKLSKDFRRNEKVRKTCIAMQKKLDIRTNRPFTGYQVETQSSPKHFYSSLKAVHGNRSAILLSTGTKTNLKQLVPLCCMDLKKNNCFLALLSITYFLFEIAQCSMRTTLVILRETCQTLIALLYSMSSLSKITTRLTKIYPWGAGMRSSATNEARVRFQLGAICGLRVCC